MQCARIFNEVRERGVHGDGTVDSWETESMEKASFMIDQNLFFSKRGLVTREGSGLALPTGPWRCPATSSAVQDCTMINVTTWLTLMESADGLTDQSKPPSGRG